MAHAGQELTAPTGMRLVIVHLDDDLLELEAHYPGDGLLPPVHLHPVQDERFEVVSGGLRVLLDGAEGVYGAGEAFDVPAGVPHQMAADVPSVVRWQVRPALRTAEFFEGLYGGQAAARGRTFLEDYADVIRFPTLS